MCVCVCVCVCVCGGDSPLQFHTTVNDIKQVVTVDLLDVKGALRRDFS